MPYNKSGIWIWIPKGRSAGRAPFAFGDSFDLDEESLPDVTPAFLPARARVCQAKETNSYTATVHLSAEAWCPLTNFRTGISPCIASLRASAAAHGCKLVVDKENTFCKSRRRSYPETVSPGPDTDENLGNGKNNKHSRPVMWCIPPVVIFASGGNIILATT